MRKKDKWFWILFIVCVVILILIVTLNYNFISYFIESKIRVYGYPAIFIFSALSNSLDQPIGPDSIAVVGYLFGLEILLVFLVVVGGTWVMDIANYSIGNRIFSYRIKNVCSIQNHRKYCDFFFKYGKFGLMFAAFMPFPDVFLSYLAGAFYMNKSSFFIFGMLPKALRIGLVLLIVSVIV